MSRTVKRMSPQRRLLSTVAFARNERTNEQTTLAQHLGMRASGHTIGLRRKVRRIRVLVGPKWGRNRPHSVELGTHVPECWATANLSQVGPEPDKRGPNSTDSGRQPVSTSSGPGWTNLGTESAKLGPSSGNSGPTSAKIDQTCPGIEQRLPDVDQLRPDFDRYEADFSQIQNRPRESRVRPGGPPALHGTSAIGAGACVPSPAFVRRESCPKMRAHDSDTSAMVRASGVMSGEEVPCRSDRSSARRVSPPPLDGDRSQRATPRRTQGRHRVGI